MKTIVRYQALIALAFVAFLPGCGSQGAGEQPIGDGDCKLQTPISIRTNDPRRNYLTESLIKLANVQFYQKPNRASAKEHVGRVYELGDRAL